MGIAALVIGWIYFPTFAWLVQLWMINSTYSYGFFIPFISLYFAWRRHGELSRLTPRPAPLTGGLVVGGSGALLLIGRLGGVTLFEAISFLALLPGLVLVVWGWNHLKALAFPLVYLQFMIPWTGEFNHHLEWPLQLLSADIGVWLLQACGIAASQKGTYIFLPNLIVEVAEACSGLMYLASLFAAGIPLVYLTQRTWWRAAGILTFGVMLAILTNGLRIALVTIIMQWYGTGIYAISMREGPLHIFQGWIVGQVGLFGLIAANFCTYRFLPQQGTRLCDRWKATLAFPTSPERVVVSNRSRAILVVFLVGLGISAYAFATPRPLPTKQPLGEFPYVVGAWYGGESSWITGNHLFPGVDKELTRTYTLAPGNEVHLYVGYFESQRQGKSLTRGFSSPLRENLREIPTGFCPLAPQYVNYSRPIIDGKRYAAIFWYRFPSGYVTGRYQAKSKQILDAVMHRQNDGAVILLAVPLTDKADDAPAPPALMAFARAVTPILQDFLP